MKIGIVLGSFSIGNRPIDFDHIYDSDRGLTGTDLAFIRVCEELEKLGNEVVRFHNVSKVDADESFDAVISFNEPNLLIDLHTSIYKVVYMMLNDFSFVRPEFDGYVDHYIGVCQEHADHVAKVSNTEGKWSVIALGCDPNQYEDKRVEGRVIWCSSADRGLHWLLQCWQDIKEAVPSATLRIMYHFNYGDLSKIEAHHISPQGIPFHIHTQEMAQRIRYMKYAIEKLKHLGVEHVGSVSRNQMVDEWNAASVFGFSCDTVAFSEGFSVSTLEAHASYTLPVITSQDCLGSVYKDSGAIMIDAPVQDNLQAFKDAVIKGLTDKEFANDHIKKCRQFALNYTWKQTAKSLNNLLLTRYKV